VPPARIGLATRVSFNLGVKRRSSLNKCLVQTTLCKLKPEIKSGNETDSYSLFADLRFVRFFSVEEIFVS
jgi:hypothetical protein